MLWFWIVGFIFLIVVMYILWYREKLQVNGD